MTAASVMVKDSEVSADFLKGGYEPRRGRIEKGFDGLFGPPRGAEMVSVLDAMIATVDEKKRALIAADVSHAREVGDDVEVRVAYDAAVAEARAIIASARNMAGDTYGPNFLPRLNLDGRTPRGGPGVRQFGRILLQAIESGDAMPAPLIPDLEPALAQFATPLRRTLDNLDAMFDAKNRELREYEETLQEKHAAFDAFEDIFDHAAKMIAEALRVIGDEALADRLQPSGRRRGVSVAVEAGETGQPEAPAPGVGEPAEPQAPAADDESVA